MLHISMSYMCSRTHNRNWHHLEQKMLVLRIWKCFFLDANPKFLLKTGNEADQNFFSTRYPNGIRYTSTRIRSKPEKLNTESNRKTLYKKKKWIHIILSETDPNSIHLYPNTIHILKNSTPNLIGSQCNGKLFPILSQLWKKSLQLYISNIIIFFFT